LYPNPKIPTLYLATNGTDALPMELMRSLMSRGGEIFVAYSAGESRGKAGSTSDGATARSNQS
jgi:hypothetical protein